MILLALCLFAAPVWGATPTSLTVDWTLSAPFTSTILERCTGAPPCTFAPLTTIPAAAGSYSESGLTPLGTYSYRARGNTGAFSAPVTGQADAVGAITLTIIQPIVNAYAIERNGVVVATPAAPPFVDTGLTPGTTYSYRVKALAANTGTESPLTGAVAGTTPAAAPPAPATNLSIAFAPTPPPPVFAATPATVAFLWRVGQPLPPAQAVTVSGGSGTWTTQDTNPWCDSTGGAWANGVSTYPAGSSVFGLQPSAGMRALAPGTYTQPVTVRRGALSATVTVRVTVSP